VSAAPAAGLDARAACGISAHGLRHDADAAGPRSGFASGDNRRCAMQKGIHAGGVGDVVVIEGRTLHDKSRSGEILEVIGEGEHTHYRMRWDDGHESIYYPASDTTLRQSVRDGAE
jgi:hypothetical protein